MESQADGTQAGVPRAQQQSWWKRAFLSPYTWGLAVAALGVGNYEQYRSAQADADRIQRLGEYYNSTIQSVSGQLTQSKAAVDAFKGYVDLLYVDGFLNYQLPESKRAGQYLQSISRSLDSSIAALNGTPQAPVVYRNMVEADNSPLVRTGAICMDGSHSSATGRGACSHHGGVKTWLTQRSQSSPAPELASSDYDLPTLDALRKLRADSFEAESQHVSDQNISAKRELLDQIRSAQQVAPHATFTIGSPEADVIRAQGTPTSITDYGSTKYLHYGYSMVTLRDGTVSEYQNTENNLHVVVNP